MVGKAVEGTKGSRLSTLPMRTPCTVFVAAVRPTSVAAYTMRLAPSAGRVSNFTSTRPSRGTRSVTARTFRPTLAP